MLSVLDATDFARLAADRLRLAVLGCVAVRSRTAAEVAEATMLAPREAVRILGRLVNGGLIRARDGTYELDEEGLRALAATLTPSEPPAASILSALDEDDAEVAAHFFRGHRLVEIPAAEGRRRSVLRVLLDEFEPGRCYSEVEVRRILRRFHPDDAALRRYLVDERMLAREDRSRTYWRGGGPPPQPV
jgi:hypothetical protein